MATSNQLGLKLKQTGMSLAAAKRSADLECARTMLVSIAQTRPSREVCADDLFNGEYGRYYELGNAAGSLFRDKNLWEFTGKWRPCETPSARARYVRIWRLK